MWHVSECPHEPCIGIPYLVPCVKVRNDRQGRWWPIIGPRHGDHEIGLPEEHWHFDARFLTFPQLLFLMRDGDEHLTPLYNAQRRIQMASGVTEGPTDVKRICLRRMPEFPCWRADGLPTSLAATIEPLYAGHTLKSCRTCPHRGFPLANLPRTDRGTVVCPGHGLEWDLGTGKLVRRVSP